MKVMTTVFLNQIAWKAENISEQYKELIKEKAAFYKQVRELIIRLNHLREKEKKLNPDN